jgi:hypothetical protein
MMILAADSTGRAIAPITEIEGLRHHNYTFGSGGFFLGAAAVGALRRAGAERGLPLPIAFCLDGDIVCPGLLVDRRTAGAACPTLALAEMTLEPPTSLYAVASLGAGSTDVPGIEPLVDAILLGRHQPDPARRRELLRAAAVRRVRQLVPWFSGWSEFGQLSSAAKRAARGRARPREIDLMRRALAPGPMRFALTSMGNETAIAALGLALAGDHPSLPLIVRGGGASNAPDCGVRDVARVRYEGGSNLRPRRDCRWDARSYESRHGRIELCVHGWSLTSSSIAMP